jgi:hypothetical protein
MVITGAMAFFGHRHVTFRHRGGGGYVREVPLFVAVTLATVVLSLIPLYAARYLADLTSVFWLNVANLSGIALGTIARYVAYKGVVWKHVHGTHHAAPAENRTVPPAENRTVHLDSGDGLTPVDEGPSRDHVRSPRLLEVQHELVGE